MDNQEDKRYSMLDVETFYKTFKNEFSLSTKESFNFIKKAYYEKNDVVALYDNENDVDCYFQLPEYSSGLVPHNRRFIYKLPSGTLEKVSKSKSPDGRFNVEINQLVKIADPYSVNKVLTKSVVKDDISIFAQIKKLDKINLVAVINAASNELLTRSE